MSAYASGKHAIGLCQRCSFVFKLSKLREDGENKLLVCAACWDEKHPAETPVNVSDAVALRRPAIDVDATNANALADSRVLGAVLGFTNYFGPQ